MASMEEIRKLREATGAGIMDAKKALDLCGGDLQKATIWLAEKGLASAAKKASREANEGLVQMYSHAGARLGVMVEINCETDFVAKTPEFKEFAHSIALQIASTGPEYIKKEDVPESVVSEISERFKQEFIDQGKPAAIAEKATVSKMDGWYKENVLLEQAFVKDDSKKIGDMLKGLIAKLGENMIIRRFTRYQLGGN